MNELDSIMVVQKTYDLWVFSESTTSVTIVQSNSHLVEHTGEYVDSIIEINKRDVKTLISALEKFIQVGD